MSTAVAEPRASQESGAARPLAHDIAWVPLSIVNVYLVGPPGATTGNWVLVDAGISLSAPTIARAAAERFGPDSRPKAIVLTHGHFDHVGALKTLAEGWDVPVYAHELELPYITGRSSYPPPDPTVGGGLMARMAYLYPDDPIDLGPRALKLPDDGSIPDMPGWRWVHTPGHSRGHVSLFRDSDRFLFAGDAFVTTQQESLLSVLTQKKEIHGPPMYFTPDWDWAKLSVRKLAEMRPAIALTGHGLPMANPRLDHDLNELARHFDELAVPAHGRYVDHPAVADATGVVTVPPPVPDPFPKVMLAVAGAAAVGMLLAATRRRD
jgi:glyoxylase-like metal-dependent hydrolase (beta-lactamase superfamily II)